MSFGNRQTKERVERNTSVKWAESSLFARRREVKEDEMEEREFLRRFTEDVPTSDESCLKLIGIMRKCVLQDRSGGDKEDRYVAFSLSIVLYDYFLSLFLPNVFCLPVCFHSLHPCSCLPYIHTSFKPCI